MCDLIESAVDDSRALDLIAFIESMSGETFGERAAQVHELLTSQINNEVLRVAGVEELILTRTVVETLIKYNRDKRITVFWNR